eukprot:s4982_g8.t1
MHLDRWQTWIAPSQLIGSEAQPTSCHLLCFPQSQIWRDAPFLVKAVPTHASACAGVDEPSGKAEVSLQLAAPQATEDSGGEGSQARTARLGMFPLLGRWSPSRLMSFWLGSSYSVVGRPEPERGHGVGQSTGGGDAVLEEMRSHGQTAEWLRRLPQGELAALIRLATEELSRRSEEGLVPETGCAATGSLPNAVYEEESVPLPVDLLATVASEVTAPRGGNEGEEETWPREGEEESSENLATTPGGSLLRRSCDRMRFSLEGAPTLLGDEERSRLLAELRGSRWRAEVLLGRAPPRLRSDQEVLLAAAREDPATLRFAADLQEDRGFWLWIVRQTKAWWLIHFGASQKLLEDPGFLERCKKAAGTGLVFTYYDDYSLFQTMRRKFPATGASVPGGEAYDAVMEEVRKNGSTATVWFGDEPVFGHNANRGTWLHPSSECGRDDIPVPPAEGRHPKWCSTVDSRRASHDPIVGKRYKCWCCRWLREVQQHHAQGEVICCAVSNIFNSDWVELYGAGSSELSDADAEAHGLPKELFRNERPKGWGQGQIRISGGFGGDFDRKAPVHPRTKKPLGVGCRWERQALDGMDFPVYAFFMP